MLIEILILLAIVAEIGWSIYDRLSQAKENKKAIGLLNSIKDILEESNQELADIRDETVEDEPASS
jgi:hypothetical protein